MKANDLRYVCGAWLGCPTRRSIIVINEVAHNIDGVCANGHPDIVIYLHLPRG